MDQNNKYQDKIIPILELKGYKLKKYIGKGGNSEVYQIFSLQYSKDFAAKVVPFCIDRREKFKNEVDIINSLNHQGIIRIYDLIYDSEFDIIIEDYHPNVLSQIIPKDGFTKIELLRLYYSLLQIIDYCHSKGIAHYDIKPLNILIYIAGRPILTDFDLSKKNNIFNNFSNFCGTFQYKSPQIIEKINHDPFKADIWSLGVTFFELATGKLPWEPKIIEEMKIDICQCKFRKYYFLDNEISKLIGQMLNLNPLKRPSIKELLENNVFKNYNNNNNQKRRNSNIFQRISSNNIISYRRNSNSYSKLKKL